MKKSKSKFPHNNNNAKKVNKHTIWMSSNECGVGMRERRQHGNNRTETSTLEVLHTHENKSNNYINSRSPQQQNCKHTNQTTNHIQRNQ